MELFCCYTILNWNWITCTEHSLVLTEAFVCAKNRQCITTMYVEHSRNKIMLTKKMDFWGVLEFREDSMGTAVVPAYPGTNGDIPAAPNHHAGP